MKTTLEPLYDRVLIKRIENTNDKTKGGIIIPDAAKEQSQEGEVIAVGQGVFHESGKLQPLTVKQGDRVLFGKYSGSEIKIDDEDFLIMRENELLGITRRA